MWGMCFFVKRDNEWTICNCILCEGEGTFFFSKTLFYLKLFSLLFLFKYMYEKYFYCTQRSFSCYCFIYLHIVYNQYLEPLSVLLSQKIVCISLEIIKLAFKYQFIYGPRREKTCHGGFCEQQRCRPACASAQSDQHLCYWLFEKYHI